MSVISVGKLLHLSIFKCKLCCNKLQRPIMLVDSYGYACGICYQRSGLTNATQNIEIETFLSNLHVSCNYKDRGCSYDGNYNNTCEHEKSCSFRDKICPFVYLGMCENTLTSLYDMADHIFNRHSKNVLRVEKNSSVVIQNPSETNRDIFYLLSLEKIDFLLRTWIDTKEQCIYYAFYYFKDEDASKNSKFSFNMGCKNTMFTVTSANVNIQHESTVRSTYDTENAVKIPLAVLKCLNCLESVEVSISIDGDALKSSTNVEELEDWKLIYEIPCENSGCRQILKGDEYNKHKDQCLFKKLKCPIQNETRCNWQGLAKEMADHLKSLHTDFVYKNVYYSGVPEIFFFLKGDDVFKQEYDLTSSGDLSIITTKLTTPVWDDSYRWEFHIKRTDEPMIMIITDVCTKKGCERHINVENYLENGKLTFYADIKHVSIVNKDVVGTPISAESMIQCPPSIRCIIKRMYPNIDCINDETFSNISYVSDDDDDNRASQSTDCINDRRSRNFECIYERRSRTIDWINDIRLPNISCMNEIRCSIRNNNDRAPNDRRLLRKSKKKGCQKTNRS